MKDCRKIRAVVFDLDGTLLNTLPDIGASANRALRRAGLPELPVENYRGLIGHGIRALFRLAVPEGTPDDVYEKALADYLADYPEHCTELTHVFPGIYEMLGRLKRAGYRLAVLSNKTERTTLRIIGKFFPETGFELVWGNNGVRSLKPAPDAGEALCKELGLMPEEIMYVGDGDTAHTGGKVWEDPEISSAVKGFVHRGGGLIGVGEPGGHQYQGRYLQLAAPLGVEKETGFTLNYDKYNWDEHRDHFILADCPDHDVDFGEGKKSIFALEGTEILIQRDKEVQMAAHEYGKGRGVYISGLPYSAANARLLERVLFYASHNEDKYAAWSSSNPECEVAHFPEQGLYCVINNTDQPQKTTVTLADGTTEDFDLPDSGIAWREA